MHPSELLTFALILLPAYFLGSVPFGLILGRLGGIDVRQHGSGNIGATNVWRVLGPKWGGATFLLDAGKGFAAVRLAENIAWDRVPKPVPEDYLAYAAVFSALACIVGHTFPLWLGFRGGKGVATSLGVLLAVMPPVATAVVLGVWVVIFAVSRYVSLASIIAAIALPITVGSLIALGELQGRAYLAFGCAAAFLVVRRHRENIKRLFAGTESRFKKNDA
jgi:glycerol-3-phosphate acyltransferase PlsY